MWGGLVIIVHNALVYVKLKKEKHEEEILKIDLDLIFCLFTTDEWPKRDLNKREQITMYYKVKQ